jgi:hypothetical protein
MLRTRPFFPTFLLLLTLLLPTPASALDILVLPTVMDLGMDAWYLVPDSSEPALYPTKRIYRGQTFRLLVLGKDYTQDSLNNASIGYKVEASAPDGTPLFGSGTELDLFKGSVSSDTSLLLSRQYLTLTFSETDMLGTYRFQVTAYDLLADTQASSTAEMTLRQISDRVPFETAEEFSIWFSNYYRDPDPGRAVSALLQYVDPERLAGKRQSPLLTFLSLVIQNNPFLWPHLKEVYAKGTTADRKKILLISAITGQSDADFFSSLDPELLEFYRDAQKIKLTEPSLRPVTAFEIDTLWAEFMATGTMNPIRKLVGALSLESTKGTQERIDSGEIELSPEIKTTAALESVYMKTLGSLIQYGGQHSLVKQYLGYIYAFDDLKPGIKAQIESILAILKRESNEEEARKQLEKKYEDK